MTMLHAGGWDEMLILSVVLILGTVIVLFAERRKDPVEGDRRAATGASLIEDAPPPPRERR